MCGEQSVGAFEPFRHNLHLYPSLCTTARPPQEKIGEGSLSDFS